MTRPFLQQKLEACVYEGTALYQRLLTVEGQQLKGTYLVRRLLDVGGQGILFLTQDLEHPDADLLLKMPLVEYHRPAYLSMEAIEQARMTILWEAYILNLFPGTIFPEIYDLFFDTDPLLDPWWKPLVMDETPYLVMELIQGHTLDDEIGLQHKAHSVDYAGLERLAYTVAQEVLNLLTLIWDEGQGFLYTDLRPPNIMLADSTDRQGERGWRRRRKPTEMALPPCKSDTFVRLVDAGSVVPAHPQPRCPHPYHPAYIPPEHYVCYERQEPLPWPDQRFVLYTLGKTLYQLVTAREPVAGQDPDFDDPKLKNYSSAFVNSLQRLIKGQGNVASFRTVFRQEEC